MTFLKKLGQLLAQGVIFATGLEPLIMPFLGSKGGAVAATAVNDFTAIVQEVVQVEAIVQGNGTGPDKLKAATGLVAGIIRTSEVISGRHIASEAAFVAACQTITSGVADLLNSLAPKIETTSDPLPTPATVPVTSAG